MFDDWKEHIEDYWLIKGHPLGPADSYIVYYIPSPGEVPFEFFEEQGYESPQDIAEEMRAHGVKNVTFDEWKQWFRSQLSPGWQKRYEEEDRKKNKGAGDETL